MTRSRFHIWSAYWIGVALVLATLAWASASVYRLEIRSDQNRAMAQRQETVRLALWRMDSRVAPMIALEAARSPDAYQSMGATSSGVSGFVRGYFEDAALQGRAATDPATDRIASLVLDPIDAKVASIESESARTVEQDVAFTELESDLAAADVDAQDDPGADFRARQMITKAIPSQQPFSGPSDPSRAMSDRSREYLETAQAAMSNAAPSAPSFEVSAVEPRWVQTPEGTAELVLLRTARLQDGEVVTQGVWIDWASLRDELLGLVSDLLPTSQLLPIQSTPQTSLRLATIPVAFVPGGAIALPPDRMTPAILAMLVTWVTFVASAIVVGLVLRTVLNLSDRRGRFVSAVTHELRTPLTTFRLYAQMLADGMVTDEKVRGEYLDTLKRESGRLSGIVENVLEYARLARRRGSKADGERQISAGELMARIVPGLSRLAEQSGMDLIVHDDLGSASEASLTLDPHAVERVMMNLVENACRYAGPEDSEDEEAETRVHLDVTVRSGLLSFLVADHGEGVAPGEQRKIFGEFARGSGRAAKDRSGLGLGLALSRGLARELGGDLKLVRRRGHGAEFELTVPIDAS